MKTIVLFLSLASSIAMADSCYDVAVEEATKYSNKYVPKAYEIDVYDEGELRGFISSSHKYSDKYRYDKNSKQILGLLYGRHSIYEAVYTYAYDFGYAQDYVAFIYSDYDCKLQNILQLGFYDNGHPG